MTFIHECLKHIALGIIIGLIAVLTVSLVNGQEQAIEEMVLELQDGPQPLAIQQQPDKPAILFENIQITDPLPDYVYAMPREEYIKWAKAQNACAYYEAELIAEKFKKRNPYRETYVRQDVGVSDSVGVMDTGYVDYNAWVQRTYYAGASTFTVYKQNAWGGGPVVILNPYAKRPPKVMEGCNPGDKVIYVADPDNALPDFDAKKEFLKKYVR